MSLQHFVTAQGWLSGRGTGSVITYPNPPTNSSSSVHICTPYPHLSTLFQQFLSYNWGVKIAITTSEMISWNVSSGTGIT